MGGIKLRALATAAGLSVMGWSHAALAAEPDEVQSAISRLQQQVADQAAQLARQQKEIERLRRMSDSAMTTARGTGLGPGAPEGAPAPITLAPPTPPEGGPVGEAPPEPSPTQKVTIAAAPEGVGVLTPKGHFVVEPQIELTHGSSNRLVFRGVEIVTGVQIGVIEASDADNNTAAPAVDLRYGLTNRLELEARLPYVMRYDRVTTLAQRDQTVTLTESVRGSHFGDIEAAARYQINSGSGAWPIFIAGLRLKSNTGSDPYTIQRDQFGVATKLATGSGFWGVESSLDALYPTDPAVLYGGVHVLNQAPRSFDQIVDGALLGRVKPGVSVTADAGFGFALNPRFSFSLGYKHTFIAPTKLELGGTVQRSQSLQAGSFTFGWAFVISPHITISNNFEVGATRDAPDIDIMFRIPIRF
ncbi:MAG: transporter [Alphaproteobacteria bacterium]|nr:transporter [Alphaproteobacteria bacterium]